MRTAGVSRRASSPLDYATAPLGGRGEEFLPSAMRCATSSRRRRGVVAEVRTWAACRECSPVAGVSLPPSGPARPRWRPRRCALRADGIYAVAGAVARVAAPQRRPVEAPRLTPGRGGRR